MAETEKNPLLAFMGVLMMVAGGLLIAICACWIVWLLYEGSIDLRRGGPYVRFAVSAMVAGSLVGLVGAGIGIGLSLFGRGLSRRHA